MKGDDLGWRCKERVGTISIISGPPLTRTQSRTFAGAASLCLWGRPGLLLAPCFPEEKAGVFAFFDCDVLCCWFRGGVLGETRVELGLRRCWVSVPRKGTTIVAVGATYGIRSHWYPFRDPEGVEHPSIGLCSALSGLFSFSSLALIRRLHLRLLTFIPLRGCRKNASVEQARARLGKLPPFQAWCSGSNQVVYSGIVWIFEARNIK